MLSSRWRARHHLQRSAVEATKTHPTDPTGSQCYLGRQNSVGCWGEARSGMRECTQGTLERRHSHATQLRRVFLSLLHFQRDVLLWTTQMGKASIALPRFAAVIR